MGAEVGLWSTGVVAEWTGVLRSPEKSQGTGTGGWAGLWMARPGRVPWFGRARKRDLLNATRLLRISATQVHPGNDVLALGTQGQYGVQRNRGGVGRRRGSRDVGAN